MGKAMIYEVEEIYNDGAYNLETEFDTNRVRIYDDNGDMVSKFTVDLNTCNVEYGI